MSNGYWKVYYDADEAEKIFSLYDTIRERVVQDIIKILD
ncbi:DUF3793 family protein [Clostridium thermarum]